MQQVKDISFVLKDSLGPSEIKEVVKRLVDLPDKQITQVVSSVVRSSKQVKLSAIESAAIIDALSQSFSRFEESEWTKEKTLGEGTYGTVSSMSKNKKRVAVKSFKNNELESDIIRELGCYALLSAARPTFYDDIVTGIKINGSVSIALKLADGTLFDLAKAFNQPTRIKMFPKVMDMCNEALAQVHACNIIHADIKSNNILVWWKGQTIEKLIIADFGLASSRPDYNDYVYTQPFRAPELRNNENDDRIYAAKRTDVWAMGMTLVEFLIKDTRTYNYDVDQLPYYIIDPTGRRAELLSMLNLYADDRLVLDEPILVFPKRDWSFKGDIQLQWYRVVISHLHDIVRVKNFSLATFVQTIDIFCRFGNAGAMNRENIQGYGLMALLIACKWGEFIHFDYDFAVKISDKAFTVKQCMQYERDILKALHGLVYLPGLEQLAETIDKKNVPKKFYLDHFINDPVELLNKINEFSR